MTELVSAEAIATRILIIRGKRVMLDRDLAQLYEVDTRQLTRQVRRNIDRFPEDFIFQLTKGELQNLMCQTGASSWGDIRKIPRSDGFALFNLRFFVLDNRAKSKKAKLKNSLAFQNWLPREDSNLGPGGYTRPEITFGSGLYHYRRLPACGRQVRYGSRCIVSEPSPHFAGLGC